MRAAPTAVIRVKGKYKPPGDSSTERALHLLVSADTQESLDIALNKLNDIIRKDQVRFDRDLLIVNYSLLIHIN